MNCSAFDFSLTLGIQKYVSLKKKKKRSKRESVKLEFHKSGMCTVLLSWLWSFWLCYWWIKCWSAGIERGGHDHTECHHRCDAAAGARLQSVFMVGAQFNTTVSHNEARYLFHVRHPGVQPRQAFYLVSGWLACNGSVVLKYQLITKLGRNRLLHNWTIKSWKPGLT